MTFVELPKDTCHSPRAMESTNLEELRLIFETEDPDETFEGFDISLQTIFLSDDENENFEGFNIP